MNKILNILFCTIILFNVEIDTVIQPYVLDLSKNLNIPGINNFKDLPIFSRSFLMPYQIDSIKQRAKNFQPQSVNEEDIVILETNKGVIHIKLFPKVAPKHCLNFKKFLVFH